jgi:hypothetical protein
MLSSKQAMKTALFVLTGTITLWAQVGGPLPGQYPPGGYPGPGGYPPGTYPGGQYPPGTGGPGIPTPRRGKKNDSSKQQDAPKYEISGIVRKLDDKSIDLASVDERFLTIQLSDKTTKPDRLKAGDAVRIEATQDNDGVYHAVNVTVDPAVAKKMPKYQPQVDDPAPEQKQEQAAAAEPDIPDRASTQVKPGGSTYDDGDSGPPTLRRGKPREVSAPPPFDPNKAATVAAAEPPEAAPARPERASIPVVNPKQEIVEKARMAAASFLQSLPNYVCHQVTTRYANTTRATDWQPIDLITTDLVYEEGKESYRNLQINGKTSKKPPEESGAWSTGEFGTILMDLFSPVTDAEFRFIKDSTISGSTSAVFDFSVERPNSHWRISVPGQFVQPAYKGTVWVDKKTFRVLRIEMQARQMPQDFPEDTVESAVDYQYIALGTAEQFLLPVHAEVLSCIRGSNQCQRNVIEFRNYHKFSGESTIKFNEQQ